MFNPYTGVPRHPEDIASDPHGIMLLDPEQPIAAAIRARETMPEISLCSGNNCNPAKLVLIVKLKN